MGQNKSPVNHWTETLLEDIRMDATIQNPGDTLEHLHANINTFCKEHYVI